METIDVKKFLGTLKSDTFFTKNDKDIYVLSKEYEITIGNIYLTRYIEDLILSKGIISQGEFTKYITRIIFRFLPHIDEYYSFDSYFPKKFSSSKKRIHLILNYLYLNNSKDKIVKFLNTIFTIPSID